ncbi:hypothetical protein SAMN02745244_01042 [Tessaracoccus bendigoensis DSM 12906]|uniref:Uncharacterized protein n=1 Tax=Tessaracoccus bendigoensis DSM 12906 TaxID=1123357 RepID=A0A1M6DX11_9ACTN|nr:hypothetical protein [Tessaracoccus bendigoensis]SHI77742.1 hypothetical protein SAMN02745244_01042 [Tessaracoccus bendigoensis DSM 12906]
MKLRSKLSLVSMTAVITLLPVPAGAASALNVDPSDRIIPVPRPCVLPASTFEIRPPRPCPPDVPSPRPCEWDFEKPRCLYVPLEAYSVAAKGDLLPPMVPGPYNPIPDMLQEL